MYNNGRSETNQDVMSNEYYFTTWLGGCLVPKLYHPNYNCSFFVLFLKDYDLTYNNMAVIASLTTNRSCNEDKDFRWRCYVRTYLYHYHIETGESIIISSYFTI